MRKARQRAASGVYHVLAEANERLLFIEKEDRRHFLQCLQSGARSCLAEVYAYCLLDESVHLVLKEGMGGISETVKNLLGGYALWFNARYSRSGKLFKDRFKSQPLEDDESLLDAVRFVHRLPLEEGGDLSDERTSYNCYLRKQDTIEYELVLMMLGSAIEFRLYNDDPAEGTYFYAKKKKVLTDRELSERIRGIMLERKIDRPELLEKERLSEILAEIRAIEGASIRQIARVLGVSKSMVERVKPKGGEYANADGQR